MMIQRILPIILFINSNILSQVWVTQINKDDSPAVTVVIVYKNNEISGFGTGFNVDANGLVVTNYHVIKDADKITVEFKEGNKYTVQHYTFIDKIKDFAILKIPGFDIPTIKMGNSNNVEIGNEVIAIKHLNKGKKKAPVYTGAF